MQSTVLGVESEATWGTQQKSLADCQLQSTQFISAAELDLQLRQQRRWAPSVR